MISGNFHQRQGPSGGRGGGLGMQVVFVLFVAMLPMAYMLQPSMLRAVPANYRAEVFIHMYMYMYVYMYVYVHVCIYKNMCTYTHICNYVYTYIYLYI